MQTSNRELSPFARLVIIFIFLNAFGFPGSYERVFGHAFEMIVEYTSFALQILVMLMSSGKTFYDIKILDLKEKYITIYLFLIVMFAGSMITTGDKSVQLISCIRVCVTAMFAIWIAENMDIKDILEEILYAQVLFVMASVTFPILFPSYDTRTLSYMNDFIGISGVKNVIATELSFGIIMQYLLWRLRVHRKEQISILFTAFMAVQFMLLIMTHGTSGMLVTIGVILYLFLYEKEKASRVHPGYLYIISSILFIVIALTVIPLFEPLLNMLGKDATLTGRIPLWRQLIEVMQNNKTFLGYGYGMFWKDTEAISLMHSGFSRYSFMGNMTSGAHNNLLELWATTGLIGVASFFITLLASFRFIRQIENSKYMFVAGYMLFYIANGWMERNWSTYEYGLLFMFMCLAAASSKPEKERKNAAEHKSAVMANYYSRSYNI